MRREFCHIKLNPMPGDVVEILEGRPVSAVAVELEPEPDAVLLRVLAVVEDYVGYKEYGKGRYWCHVNAWRRRLGDCAVGVVIRPGDHDMPF